MGRIRVDLHPGSRFGHLTVLEIGGKRACGEYRWLCRCDCGSEREYKAWNLRSGTTQSCGCMKKVRKPVSEDEGHYVERHKPGKYECAKCEIDFSCSETLKTHNDMRHV